MFRRIILFLLASLFAFYINAQSFCGQIEDFNNLYNRGLYKDAITIGMEYEKICTNKNDANYAFFLDKLAECEYELEYFNNAKSHLYDALKIKRKIFGSNSIEYAQSLNILADCHNSTNSGHFSMKKRALKIVEKNKDENKSAYYRMLISCANYYNDTTYISLVENYLSDMDTLSIEYADALLVIAEKNFYANNFENAIFYYKKSLEIKKSHKGITHPDIAHIFINLADCYIFFDKYSIALSLYIKANKIYHNCFGRDSWNYIHTLSEIANIKVVLDDFGNAIAMTDTAIFLAKEKYGEISYEHASVLSKSATLEYGLNNFSRSIEHQTKANEILKNLYGETNEEYIVGLFNLSLYYYYNDTINMDRNLELVQKYNKFIRKKHGEDDFLYANGLSIESRILQQLGQCQLGLQKAKQAILILEKLENYPHMEAAAWGAMSDYYYHCCPNQDSLLEVERKVLNLCKEYDNNDEYICMLGEYADCLCKLGRYDEGLKYYELYFQHRKNWIIEVFSNLRENRRFELWNVYGTNEYVLETCYALYHEPRAHELAYNMALFNKGLLLSSEQIYRNTNSDNYSLQEFDYNISETSLYDTVFYEQLYKEFSIEWRDIQSSLNETDVAIEFVSFETSDSLLYCALVLKKDYSHPQMIELFSSNILEDLKNNSLYNSLHIYNHIWEKLETEFNDVETIYFSPDGILHSIAIEYALLPTEQRMTDKYNIYRLSSTRQLAKKYDKDYIKESSIAIFGGFNYNSNFIEISDTNTKNDNYTNDHNYIAERTTIEGHRGTLSELNGSLIEIQSVAELVPQEYKSFIYSDSLGTEESFKRLSGKYTNIIHISTHGYYWDEKTWSTNKHIPHLPKQINEEDLSLTRSGLYMAGANSILSGEKIPQYIEDGMLTAREISELDLQGLDMVVLSACQTGLGDLKSDGVFGLQRGFKKSGANTILMSLWKVNDYATQLLMVEFYRNYFSGISKIQSLENAQKYVREFHNDNGDKPFENPYYWAGFILLDALE